MTQFIRRCPVEEGKTGKLSPAVITRFSVDRPVKTKHSVSVLPPTITSLPVPSILINSLLHHLSHLQDSYQSQFVAGSRHDGKLDMKQQWLTLLSAVHICLTRHPFTEYVDRYCFSGSCSSSHLPVSCTRCVTASSKQDVLLSSVMLHIVMW